MAILKRGEGLTKEGFAHTPRFVRVLMRESGVRPPESWRRGEGPGRSERQQLSLFDIRGDFGNPPGMDRSSLKLSGPTPQKLGE
jgi:hypothetical protein